MNNARGRIDRSARQSGVNRCAATLHALARGAVAALEILMRLSRYLLLSVLALTILTACGGAPDHDSEAVGGSNAAPTRPAETAANAKSTVVGTYAALSVDGNQLPYSDQYGEETVELLSGTLILEPDGRWRESGQWRYPNQRGGDPIVAESNTEGVYTVTGDRVTFSTTGYRYVGERGRVTTVTDPDSLPAPFTGTIRDGILTSSAPVFLDEPNVQVIYRRQ